MSILLTNTGEIMRIQSRMYKLLITFVMLALCFNASAKLPPSGLRAIALINDSDETYLTGVDVLAADGIQVVVLHADRLTNLAQEVETVQMRLSLAMEAALKGNPTLYEYILDESVPEDLRSEAIAEFAKQSAALGPLTDELEAITKRFAAAFPEARTIGELSTKLDVTEAPTIVFEDRTGFKIVADTLNLENAMAIAVRRDYDRLK